MSDDTADTTIGVDVLGAYKLLVAFDTIVVLGTYKPDDALLVKVFDILFVIAILVTLSDVILLNTISVEADILSFKVVLDAIPESTLLVITLPIDDVELEITEDGILTVYELLFLNKDVLDAVVVVVDDNVGSTTLKELPESDDVLCDIEDEMPTFDDWRLDVECIFDSETLYETPKLVDDFVGDTVEVIITVTSDSFMD